MVDNGSALRRYHLITLATRTMEQTLLGGAPWRLGPRLERVKSSEGDEFSIFERFELSNITELRGKYYHDVEHHRGRRSVPNRRSRGYAQWLFCGAPTPQKPVNLYKTCVGLWV